MKCFVFSIQTATLNIKDTVEVYGEIKPEGQSFSSVSRAVLASILHYSEC